MNKFVKIFLISCALTHVSVASQWNDLPSQNSSATRVNVFFENKKGQSIGSDEINIKNLDPILGKSLISNVKNSINVNQLNSSYPNGFDLFLNGEQVDKNTAYNISSSSWFKAVERDTFAEPRCRIQMVFDLVGFAHSGLRHLELSNVPKTGMGLELYHVVRTELDKKLGHPTKFSIINQHKKVEDSGKYIYDLSHLERPKIFILP